MRQSGYDPASGRRRVKQFATLPTKRAATAYRASVVAGRAGTETETVAQFLRQVWPRPSRAGSRPAPPTSTSGPRVFTSFR